MESAYDLAKTLSRVESKAWLDLLATTIKDRDKELKNLCADVATTRIIELMSKHCSDFEVMVVCGEVMKAIESAI